MPYDQQLAGRIREALLLAGAKKIEEKIMFRGITFMVNGKMCISTGGDEIMCRIGPSAYESALERDGVRPMIHGGKSMKGFVFVGPAGYKGKKNFDFWINAVLAFNGEAKPAKKTTANKASKKSAPKKTAPEKSSPKKTATKKTTPEKTVMKKAASKKIRPKKK